MQFDSRVLAAHWDEDNRLWRLTVRDEKDGRTREMTCRFVSMMLGLLSQPTVPRLEGMDSFKGPSFHTYYWPQEPVDLTGKKVAVIGTGATAIQVIGEIADKVGELTVFQRRPNWSCPLNNGAISNEEMADIRRRYDEIFDTCARSPGGFEHEPDRRGFYEVSREERLELWDKLYDSAGLRHLARQLPRDLHGRGGERRVLRVHRRAHPPAREGPEDGREADPQGPRLRRAARAARDQILRSLQPTQREAGRSQGNAADARDRDRPAHHRARLRVRHHRLCHRLRRHHRRLRSYRHPRRRMARRCATSGGNSARATSA